MTIVYTAILGGCDSLKPAPAGADCCVCLSDDRAHISNSKGWEIHSWEPPFRASGARREAWRLRCIPHKLFEYETSIWIDASFTVTDLPKLLRDAEGHDLSALRHHTRKSCYEEAREVVRVGQADAADVAKQMARYSGEGFRPSALSISCIIVRQNNAKVTAFNELWDAEIQKHPGDNTQLSLDYCAWKTGVGVHALHGVRKDNPYAVHDHADHKKRRKPYR